MMYTYLQLGNPFELDVETHMLRNGLKNLYRQRYEECNSFYCEELGHC